MLKVVNLSLYVKFSSLSAKYNQSQSAFLRNGGSNFLSLDFHRSQFCVSFDWITLSHDLSPRTTRLFHSQYCDKKIFLLCAEMSCVTRALVQRWATQFVLRAKLHRSQVLSAWSSISILTLHFLKKLIFYMF